MQCIHCGKQIPDAVKFCIFCGQSLSPQGNPIDTSLNTSGKGSQSQVPPEIAGWSWGGFLWGWVWAIGNNTFIGLLSIIPTVGFIMNIFLGLKGREWAWRNKYWSSVEEFKKIQRRWVIWWFILFPFFALLGMGLAGIVAVGVLSAINPQEQVKKARDAQAKNSAVELHNASERYFLTNNYYPWNNSADDSASEYYSLNVISEPWLVSLITDGFIKDTINTHLSQTQMMVFKTLGDSGNLYFCYQALSKDNIAKAANACNQQGTINYIQSKHLCPSGKSYLCVPEDISR